MYNDILYPRDISENSAYEATAPVVAEYMQRFNAKLHILHVVPPLSKMVSQYFPNNSREKILEEAKNALREFLQEHLPDLADESQLITAEGSIHKEIVHTAKEIKADLIIMSAHGKKVEDYLLGSNVSKVMHRSTSSVLVVREAGRKGLFKR